MIDKKHNKICQYDQKFSHNVNKPRNELSINRRLLFLYGHMFYVVYNMTSGSLLIKKKLKCQNYLATRRKKCISIAFFDITCQYEFLICSLNVTALVHAILCLQQAAWRFKHYKHNLKWNKIRYYPVCLYVTSLRIAMVVFLCTFFKMFVSTDPK